MFRGTTHLRLPSAARFAKSSAAARAVYRRFPASLHYWRDDLRRSRLRDRHKEAQ